MSYLIDKIKLFILDMDGTIYLGSKLFPFTADFLNKVSSTGRDFCFFTNNSSKNRESYISKLSDMGISVKPSQMLISSDVIISWLLKNHSGESAYVVGTPDLINDFKKNGVTLNDNNPDYVVLGFDTTLTYDKLVRTCNFVRTGTPIYGVNPDLNCPTETGFIPDCGAMAALIKASTGVQCSFFGKPSPHTLNFILESVPYTPDEIAVIGDRLYTDIALTENSEVTSILVLSGEATISDVEKSRIKPDVIVKNLSELIALL